MKPKSDANKIQVWNGAKYLKKEVIKAIFQEFSNLAALNWKIPGRPNSRFLAEATYSNTQISSNIF